MESISLMYVQNGDQQDLMLQLEKLDYLRIKWLVQNISYIKKGQMIARVSYEFKKVQRSFLSYDIPETHSFVIFAPNDGLIYILDDGLIYKKEKERLVLEETEPKIWRNELQQIALVFQNIDELLIYHFNTDGARLEIDPYTHSSEIKWDKFRGITSEYGVITLDYINDKAVLVLDSEMKLRKGDCISLRFENDKILDYQIQNEQYNDTFNTYLYYFTLYEEDLDLLFLNELDSYRITYLNNRLPVKTVPSTSLYILSDNIYVPKAIPIYTRCYLHALNRLVPNYILPQRTITKSPTEYNFNWCYVYLMKDTSNGYYKIGISNTPEYRERTLQSEKPSIEMIACKKFPTRKIAESIESALHTSYSQQRLRGEWFNLTDADVAVIIETLK